MIIIKTFNNNQTFHLSFHDHKYFFYYFLMIGVHFLLLLFLFIFIFILFFQDFVTADYAKEKGLTMKNLSGTKFRQMLRAGDEIPTW